MLAKMLSAFDDKRARATSIVVCNSDDETTLFTHSVKGTIVEPVGSEGFGWDAIFKPDGSDLTFGQMTPEQKALYSPRSKCINAFFDAMRRGAFASVSDML